MPENSAPAMYMVWPHERPVPSVPSIPVGYRLRTIVSEEIDKGRPVIETDGLLSDSEWSWFRNAVVPDGMFVIEERASSTCVGAISAVHNPAATRYYFPGGGGLGYLVVALPAPPTPIDVP